MWISQKCKILVPRENFQKDGLIVIIIIFIFMIDVDDPLLCLSYTLKLFPITIGK